MQSHLIDTALAYLYEGLNPLPLKSNKAPMLPVGHGYLYESVEDTKVNELFERAEKIGIACGKVSGQFECLDFDGKNGEPIAAIFEQFIATDVVAAIISRNNLPCFTTPSGGRHIYYRYEGDCDASRALAHWPSKKVMIETRGHGSYVAVHPSTGYTRISGSDIVKVATITAEERDCLLAVAESLTQYTRTTGTGGSSAKSDREWPKKFDTSTPIGRYNEECEQQAKDLLLGTGWKYLYTRKYDKVEYWQRPGKESERAVSATWGRQRHMFYCWTDSMEPFAVNTAYTPFDIYMMLVHDGDLKKATAALYRRWDDTSAPELSSEFLGTPSTPLPPPPVSPPLGAPVKPVSTDPPAVCQLSEPTKVSFPIEVFPQQLQEFIRQMHTNLNFTPDFTSVAAMFAIATMNGNKYKLRVNEVWVAPTLFWFGVVGDPGTMKSHPISAMIKPIKKIDIENKAVHSKLMEEFDAAIMDKSVKHKPKKPQFRQIMISDVTLEAIHYVHTVNRRGLGYHKDELVGFMNSMNQYKSKGSDEQFWLESFNNQPYMVNRATKETLSIEDTMINIIGTIQPNILSKISTENGLTDRFLYTSAEKTIPYMADDKMSPDWFKWWNQVILKANTMFQYLDSQDTVIVEMDGTATDYLKQLDAWLVGMQTSDEHNESLKTYLSKAKTYIPRFALLMAVIDAVITDAPIAVKGDHMERAGHIMSYFIETGRQVFDESARVEEIVGIIKSKTGLTRPELIYQLYKKGISNSEIARQVKVSKANVGQTIKRMTEKEAKK